MLLVYCRVLLAAGLSGWGSEAHAALLGVLAEQGLWCVVFAARHCRSQTFSGRVLLVLVVCVS